MLDWHECAYKVAPGRNTPQGVGIMWTLMYGLAIESNDRGIK